MAIIKDCEIWFAKVDPKHPSTTFNKENPTWECQIRTKSKDVKKEWESLNLPVKAVVPDEGETYFRVNLRKKSIKEDGKESSPVEVVDGALKPVDPLTIGNGSIGNVRVYQYNYTTKGKSGIANVLMGIQLTKHIVYKPKPRDDSFGETATERIEPEAAADAADEEPYN